MIFDGCFSLFRPGLSSAFGISNENRPAYRNTSHPQRAFVQLNCMREEGILTDVALVASGHEVNIFFSFKNYFLIINAISHLTHI